MDKDIFHYLGKQPLKISTEFGAQAQPSDQPAPEAIELPPAGTTSIGLNIPGPAADAADAATAETANALNDLRAASASGDWPVTRHDESSDVPASLIGAAADLNMGKPDAMTPPAPSLDTTGWTTAAADHPVIITSGVCEAASSEATATRTEGTTASETAAGSIAAPAPTLDTAWQAASVAALPWRNNPLIMAIAASFIAIYIAWNSGGFTDNDVWFILATGREILENGIPYTNPFAVYDNMGIVVQQWVPCVITYSLYSLGGFVALGLWVGTLSALVVLSLYRLGRLVKGDRFGGEWILLAIAVAVPALLGYLSMRPHAYTMLAFCWLLFFLEKYRRSGKPGWLAGSVALIAAHVNFQMALAPFDLVIIGCYLVPNVLAPLHKRGRLTNVQLALGSYKRWPVLLCLVLAAAALMANPYGLDGALYLVDSYGVASYNNHILEMRALAPWSKGLAGMASVAMLVLAATAAGKRGLRSIDLPLTLLAFGVGLAAFSHSRNGWLIAFFALPLVMSTMHGWSMDFAKLPPRKKIAALGPEAAWQWMQKRHKIVLGCTAAIALGAAVASGVLLWQASPEWRDYEKESSMAPAGLLDYLEKQGKRPEDVQLFSPFNIGGYLEWRGYKVSMDPRPELWAPAISGHSTDYFREYVDMMSGDWKDRDYAEFLERNNFDYLVVENGSKLATYLKDFPNDYVSLLGTGDYTLWGKKGDPGTSGTSSNAGSASTAADNGTNSANPSSSNTSNGRDASAQQM